MIITENGLGAADILTEDGKITITLQNEKENPIILSYDNKSLDHAFDEDGVSILRPFSLDDLLYNEYGYNRIQTIDRINTREVDKFCVIRNWLYKMLKSDMEKLFKENDYVEIGYIDEIRKVYLS